MRTRTVTEKVRTPFGSCYSHVEFDEQGNALTVSFSHPSKHKDTSVGYALEALGDVTTSIIQAARDQRIIAESGRFEG